VKPVFEKIVGQEAVKNLLAQALRQRAYSHAYLFEGPSGLGKEAMAREFAAAIFCSSENPPCHTCKSCHQVAAGTHPELRIIQPEDPEKDTTVSVEVIRTMIKDIYLKPYHGDWKVYIIPQADIMTFQAQNALLKTLEEPPDHAVMILTSSKPQALLPTVLSRCQKADFRPVQRERIETWLQEFRGLPREQASALAAYAHGTPDRAVKMLDSESYRQHVQLFLTLTEVLSEGRLSPLLEAGEFLQRDKNQTLEILSMWQEWIRDLQVISLGGEEDLLIHQDQIQRLKQQASLFSSRGYSQALTILEEAREDLINYGNLAFVSEMVLVNLQKCLVGHKAGTL